MKNLITGAKIPTKKQTNIDILGQRARMYYTLKSMVHYHRKSKPEAFTFELFRANCSNIPDAILKRFWKANKDLDFNY